MGKIRHNFRYFPVMIMGTVKLSKKIKIFRFVDKNVLQKKQKALLY